MYRKKYEDSYLDDESEEFDGSDKTDAQRIVEILEKPERTEKDAERIKKITERLFNGAKMPGPVGEQALYGIELVAGAYANLGDTEPAIALWARLSDLAEAAGNRDLYYKATEEMGLLS